MKKLLFETRKYIGKALVFLLLLYFIIFPEHLMHGFLVVIHALFAGSALAFEKVLGSAFNISKFHSHLILVYLGSAMGLFGLYGLWRKLPKIVKHIKNYLLSQLMQLKTKAINMWQKLSIRQKIKLFFLQLISVMGVLTLLVA